RGHRPSRPHEGTARADRTRAPPEPTARGHRPSRPHEGTARGRCTSRPTEAAAGATGATGAAARVCYSRPLHEPAARASHTEFDTRVRVRCVVIGGGRKVFARFVGW